MRHTVCTLAITGFLALGLTCGAHAQDDTAAQQPAAQQSAAQTPATHRHQLDADHDLARMTKRLKLSQDQQSQIKPILQDRDQQLNQLWQDTSVSRQDRRTKAMQIRQDSDAKIKPILNDEQQQKYSSMEMRHHHRKSGNQSGATGGQDTTPQQPQ